MVVAAMIGGVRKHSVGDRKAMALEEWAEPYVRAWTALPGASVTISERGGHWMVLLGVYNAKVTGPIVQKLWGATSGEFSNALAVQVRDEVLGWFKKELPQDPDPLIETTLQSVQKAEPYNFEFERQRVEPVVTVREHVQLGNADGRISVSGRDPSRVAAASSRWTAAIVGLQALTLVLVAMMVWKPVHVPTPAQTDTETRRLQLGSALASYQLVRQSGPQWTGMSDSDLKTIAQRIKAVLDSCPNGQSTRAKGSQPCPAAVNKLSESSEAIDRELKARDQGNNNREQLNQLLEQWSKDVQQRLTELSSGKVR